MVRELQYFVSCGDRVGENRVWQELRAFEEEARRNNLYALSSWSYSVVGALGLLLPGPGGVESCFSCLCLLQSVFSYLSDVHFVGTNMRMWVLDITCAAVTFFFSMGIWGVSTGTFALKYALGASCLACSATLFRMQHRLFRPLHIVWHALPFSLYLEIRPHDEVGAQILVLAALAATSTLFIFPPGSFASRPAALVEDTRRAVACINKNNPLFKTKNQNITIFKKNK